MQKIKYDRILIFVLMSVLLSSFASAVLILDKTMDSTDTSTISSGYVKQEFWTNGSYSNIILETALATNSAGKSPNVKMCISNYTLTGKCSLVNASSLPAWASSKHINFTFPTLTLLSGKYNVSAYTVGSYSYVTYWGGRTPENYPLATLALSADNTTITPKNGTSDMRFYGNSSTVVYAYKTFGNSSISTFSFEIDGVANYTTTTGFKGLNSSIVNKNITFYATGYVNKTYENVTTSTVYRGYLAQALSMRLRFYNEETGSLIASSIDVKLSSSSYLSSGNTANGTIYFTIPNSGDYIIFYNSSLYQNKFYYFTASSGSYYDINLYFTPVATTATTFTIYDSYGNGVENAMIKILRQIEGGSSYVMVSMEKTDSSGIAIIPIVQGTVVYQVYVEYNNILMNVPQAKSIQSNTVTISINIDSLTGTNINFINGVTSILTNDWKNTTNFNATHTFSDSSNTITAGCVKVYLVTTNSHTLINSSCTSSPSGTAKVRIYRSTGYYLIYGTVKYSGHEYKLSEYLFNLAEDDVFKTKEVLFIVMFLLFTLGILGFLISPPFGFIMLGVGLIMMGLITSLSLVIAMPFAIIMFILAIIIGNYLSR